MRYNTPSINIQSIGYNASSGTTSSFVSCWSCKKMNDYGMDYCEKCGESLKGGEYDAMDEMNEYFSGSNLMA